MPARTALGAAIVAMAADLQLAGSDDAPVARPASGEERAVMEARRPDELFMPIPRHLVPLPTPGRVLAQVRARVNHFYVLTRLETLSAGPPPGTDGQASPAGPRGGGSDHASGTDGRVTTRSGRGEKD